ncbi:MAG: alpha/beta hydrolase family protein [Egibacteraceae bacterium]
MLGGSAARVPQRFALASPIARLPLGIPQLLVHGDADRHVPISQSRAYASAAQAAGDVAELVEFPGMGHFEPLDPDHPSWQAVAVRLPELLRGPGPHQSAAW